MKLIYSFVIFALFLLIACENGKKEIKVYSAFDENYLTEDKLDKKPTFADKENYKDILNQISEAVANYRAENGISSFGSSSSEERSFAKIDSLFADRPVLSGIFEAYLFINREGSVDKIFVIEAPNQEIVSMVSEKLMNLKFMPGEKDSKPVASRYKFHYNLYMGNPNVDVTYFVAVEQMPEPIGGIQSIAEKVKYPEIAKRAGIEGRVFVKAYIDTNGNVAKAEIIKGIGSGCDEAAIEAVKKSKFTPGEQRGKKVNVQVSIPILFKLQ